jgi:hypothetical protein
MYVESRTPSFAQLYVFDSFTETGCCVMDGWDREIGATIQLVLSQVTLFVEMYLRAGEFTRNQEVFNVPLKTHEDQEVDLRKHNRPTCNEVAAILLTIMWDPNETFFCIREVGD